MAASISVLVSTRNRPGQVVSCVRRILASTEGDFELIVVDQSPPQQSAEARRAVGTDARLRWMQSATQGLSVSRNLALSAASAPLIAFTDDDCEAPPDWLASVRREFQVHPDLDMVFGAVEVPRDDGVTGYAANFEPVARIEITGQLPDIRRGWGVGANMAFRRRLFDRTGHFDELLGAGARFLAGEEIDFAIRALALGFKAAYTPQVRVLHRGVRQGVDAGRLLRGYGIGLGATLAKHRRLRTPGAAHLLTHALAHHGLRSMRNLLRGDRHPGFGLTAAILLGALRSHRFGVDAQRGVFDATRSGQGT